MGKALLQFILLISSDAWAKLAQYSSRDNIKPDHGAPQFKTRKRPRQIARLLRLPVLSPLIRFALLAGITILSFPMNAPAAQVTLAWKDKNQAVDGFQVFQRKEGSAFDYAKPVWTSDGRDPNKTSCTISGLADGIKYHFVVRAYAENEQSPNSNQVTYMAPASSPITIVNDNHPPVAEAGANKSVNAGDWVALDASG
ncbi:MAG: fibronectin type III domain-containing protein, partial [Desulfobacterales bacterium]